MRPERINVLWHGLVAGLLGYATVAVVFALGNILVGRSPFYTAALLGDTIFYGLQAPSGVSIWAGPVFAYNGLHLGIFLVLGMVASWLADLAERGPHFWYIGAVLFAIVATHMIGLLFVLPESVRAVMLGWSVAFAGLLAVAVMAGYLIWAHPGIRREIKNFAARDADLADQIS